MCVNCLPSLLKYILVAFLLTLPTHPTSQGLGSLIIGLPRLLTLSLPPSTPLPLPHLQHLLGCLGSLIIGLPLLLTLSLPPTSPLPLTHLQHLLCGLGSLIIGCTSLEVILVLLAVHPIMDGFTQDAVLFVAHLAGELIYIIVIETESFAVWCPTVEAVSISIFSLSKTPKMNIFNFLFCQ